MGKEGGRPYSLRHQNHHGGRKSHRKGESSERLSPVQNHVNLLSFGEEPAVGGSLRRRGGLQGHGIFRALEGASNEKKARRASWVEKREMTIFHLFFIQQKELSLQG